VRALQYDGAPHRRAAGGGACGTNPDAADTFNLNVFPTGPHVVPVNDTFTTPLALRDGGTAVGTTVAATDDAINYGPSCRFVHNAVWYSFTAPEDDVYVFDLNGSALKDTALAVFDACDSNNGALPAFRGCDDDGGILQYSRIDGALAAGESVCIAVAGHFLSDAGDFTLHASRLPPPPPNDRCEGALPLVGTVTGENFSSRPETDVSTSCNVQEFALWYSFTAPADGDYKFDLKQTAPETNGVDIALFDACGPAPAAQCSDASDPAASRHMSAGDTVKVRVSTNVFLRNALVVRAH